jgi:drug/metabolite transporter (DMT)-like permease
MLMFPIIVCGLLGGFGTIFGKLAFSSDNIPINQLSEICHSYTVTMQRLNCEYSITFVRIIAAAMMLGSNALVVGYFLRAIEVNNTVVVIVISSAMNFLTSGVFGQLLFGEIVGKSWYFGSLLIVIGMLLVSYSQGQPDKIVVPSLSSSSSSNPSSRKDSLLSSTNVQVKRTGSNDNSKKEHL